MTKMMVVSHHEEHEFVDENNVVDELVDEVVEEVVDEVSQGDDFDNNTKQIKVISLELGSDTETNENNTFFQEDNTNENLNIEKVEGNMDNNQSIDDVSEPSYNPLNQEKVENVENMETEINNQQKYGKYNVKQLREHALEKNLGDAKIIKNMKKQDLLTLILNNESNP